MSTEISESSRVAEAYYDSSEADRFYSAVWGGEDIHIGLYEDRDTDIGAASHRTVEEMACRLDPLPAGSHVLDIGAGYGGAARHLAATRGFRVTCLNISALQNATNERLTGEQGLDRLVTVRHGSFENIPFDDESFDAVWSQDSLLHSGRRRRVLEEVYRVLEPGGHFVFTDPMQADDCPDGVLQPVLDRIHLDSMGSFALYRDTAEAIGFETVELVDLTAHLPRHYARVRAELQERHEEMIAASTRDYVDRMIDGLGHWVDAGEAGHLAWGILHFRKGRA